MDKQSKTTVFSKVKEVMCSSLYLRCCSSQGDPGAMKGLVMEVDAGGRGWSVSMCNIEAEEGEADAKYWISAV